MNTRNKKYSAFSFIEVMLSVFLVSVGLIAAMSLITKGLSETLDSRSQVTASLLAQEGIELMRNERDKGWLNGNENFSNIPDVRDYRIDYNGTSYADLRKLYINNTDFYTHNSSSATPTKFSRKIIISYLKYQNMIGTCSNLHPCYKEEIGGNPSCYLKCYQPIDRLYAEAVKITSIVIWGGDFSSVLSDCTTANKCAYAESILSKWNQNTISTISP